MENHSFICKSCGKENVALSNNPKPIEPSDLDKLDPATFFANITDNTTSNTAKIEPQPSNLSDSQIKDTTIKTTP